MLIVRISMREVVFVALTGAMLVVPGLVWAQTGASPKICPNGVVVYDTVCPPILPRDGFLATDLAFPSDSPTTIWSVSTVPTDKGFVIKRWNGFSGTWETFPGAATRIAVSPKSLPWVINSVGNISYNDGAVWRIAPGTGIDIAVNGETVWAILANGYVHRWNPTNLQWIPYGALAGAGRKAIAVAPNNNAWTVNNSGKVSWIAVNTTIWTDLLALPSGLAVDIGVTRIGVAFVLGSDFKVWKWSGTAWVLVKQLGSGDRISTGGDAVYVASASTGQSQKVL